MVTRDDVLGLIVRRPATIPDGVNDVEIGTYIDEALPVLLAYCRALPPKMQNPPDALLYAWAEIATVLMWKNFYIKNQQASSVKEDDTSVSFAKGKIDGTRIVYESLDNIQTMNRYRSLF